MATQADLRRIALWLPDARDEASFVFSVTGTAFAWPWKERIDQKRARAQLAARPARRGRRPADLLKCRYQQGSGGVSPSVAA